MVLAWVLAFGMEAKGQGGAGTGDVQVAVERAIALGKSGQYSDGLSVLAPYLSTPTPTAAKACYVAGFLHKERYKQNDSSSDRTEAVAWLGTSLDLDDRAGGRAPWRESARQAMSYLGGTYFDDAVLAVRAFEPGDETGILALFDAHVAVAKRLNPGLDATQERTEFHKNIARAYHQWFSTTGDDAHFEGVVTHYERALALSPQDITATYNLAVSIYNRGVALLKSFGVETSFGEMIAMQEQSAAFFDQALPWFERANELQPNRPETLRGLMIVHHALQDNAASEAFRVQLENALKP